MKSFIKLLLGYCTMIILLSGCSKGGSSVAVDVTNPTISVTSPTAGQSFVAGNTIPFQVTFADNIALKSYEVAITKNLTGGLVLKVVPTSVPFNYTKSTTTLSGKSQVITLTDVIIPANTATTLVTTGTYNVKVTCVDSSNNSYSTTVQININ